MTDKITINRATLQQALDALQDLEGYRPDIDAAIITLLAAMAAPQPATSSLSFDFLQAVINLCRCKGASPESIEGFDPDQKWVADLWREAERMKSALQPALQTCNCRWDGDTQVQQCTLHEAHIAAIHEWAERAKAAEAKLAAPQPARTALEQYDLEQSPNYRKGWDDGRIKGYEVGHRHGMEQHQFSAKAAPQPAQEPLFWYRPCSNGMYEGPIHNAQIERVRKESGAWAPLYAAPQHQPAQEPVGYISKTGHGTYFRETLTDELKSLEWADKKMWKAVFYAAPQPQRQTLTDEFVRLVVRSKQPHLSTESKAWKDLFASCKYWLEAAHGITGGTSA